MTTSSDYEPSPDEAFEVEGDPFPFSAVPDWITLGAEHDRDVRVFAILRAHVNQRRKDNESWPSQGTIATILGLSKPDEVGKSIARLVKMGAVSKRIVVTPTGRRTIYRTWLEPRPGVRYEGPRCTADLYAPGALEQIHAERVATRQQPGRSPKIRAIG